MQDHRIKLDGTVAASVGSNGDTNLHISQTDGLQGRRRRYSPAPPPPETIDVEIGGMTRREHWDSFEGLNERDRPEWKTTERLTNANVWEPCVGSTTDPHNCFQPWATTTGFCKGDRGCLEASVQNKDYKILAVEAVIRCTPGESGQFMVKLYKLSKATVKVFYNEKQIGHWSAGSTRQSCESCEGSPVEQIILPVGQTSKEMPVLRVELQPTSNDLAVGTIKIEARKVMPSFEKMHERQREQGYLLAGARRKG